MAWKKITLDLFGIFLRQSSNLIAPRKLFSETTCERSSRETSLIGTHFDGRWIGLKSSLIYILKKMFSCFLAQTFLKSEAFFFTIFSPGHLPESQRIILAICVFVLCHISVVEMVFFFNHLHLSGSLRATLVMQASFQTTMAAYKY